MLEAAIQIVLFEAKLHTVGKCWSLLRDTPSGLGLRGPQRMGLPLLLLGWNGFPSFGTFLVAVGEECLQDPLFINPSPDSGCNVWVLEVFSPLFGFGRFV